MTGSGAPAGGFGWPAPQSPGVGGVTTTVTVRVVPGRARNDAAKALLDAGWTFEEVEAVLAPPCRATLATPGNTIQPLWVGPLPAGTGPLAPSGHPLPLGTRSCT